MNVTQYVADRIAALRLRDVGLASASSTVPHVPSIEPDMKEQDTNEDPVPTEAVPGGYKNVSVVRANAMKFLPNFFEKGQVSGMHDDDTATAETALHDSSARSFSSFLTLTSKPASTRPVSSRPSFRSLPSWSPAAYSLFTQPYPSGRVRLCTSSPWNHLYDHRREEPP